MTKIKAFVAFQCLRSWSMALRCFNFRITICNFNLITFSGGGEVEMARCSGVTIIVLNYVLPMTLSYRVYVICVC